MASIRRLTSEDAGELAALLVTNREFLAPFEPDRDERFYTAEGQRQRIESGEQLAFAILERSRIAGTVALSNITRGPFQSANLGYWVAQDANDHIIYERDTGELMQTDAPVWLLRFSTLNIASQLGLAPAKFRITVSDIERYGPGIVVDYGAAGSSRVLVWVD